MNVLWWSDFVSPVCGLEVEKHQLRGGGGWRDGGGAELFLCIEGRVELRCPGVKTREGLLGCRGGKATVVERMLEGPASDRFRVGGINEEQEFERLYRLTTSRFPKG